MPTQATALKLVTPATHKHGTPRSTQSRQIQQLATMWNALSMEDRNGWKALSQTPGQGTEVAVPSKSNGYSFFVGINTMLQGAGMDYNTSPPATREQPYALPTLTLTASLATGSLALTLHSAAAYSPFTIVYAAKPAYAGNNSYPKNAFKRLGSLAELALGPNDLTAMFHTKFRIPQAGYEIALKFVGVMDTGFHTNSYVVTCIASE